MMNPMPKLPLALLALAMMTGIASAQLADVLRRERQGRWPFGERLQRHDDELRCQRQGDQPRDHDRQPDDDL